MSEDRRRGLRDMLDELDRYFEEFEKEIQNAVREGISGTKLFSKPFVAGFQMRIGPEGKPSVQFFGDSPQQNDGFRAPMTEQVIDGTKGLLRLVLDMPGVDKDDIEISVANDAALVKAEKGTRKYRGEVQLKAQVEPDSGRAEYRNGVLEISFSLRDKANKGFRRVRVV